jgi:hypothetical protein
MRPILQLHRVKFWTSRIVKMSLASVFALARISLDFGAVC